MPDTFLLTSTSIKASPTGDYNTYETTFLFPHEVLRREFMRASKAVESFDLVKCPWKIHCFNKWYTDFFLPAVHEHHDIEEKIFFPFYSKLGCPTPNLQCEDHKMIISHLEDIRDRSAALLNLVIANANHESDAKIHELVAEFKTTVHNLTEKTLVHLAEEERFWTPVCEQYGEAKRKEVEQMIVKEGINHGGQAFQNFGCAIADSMKITICADPYEASLKSAGVNTHIDGWANKRIQTEFMSALPYPVRKLLMPGWNKRYLKFRAMINSCAGEVDILHVQDEVVATGCACIIS